MAKSKITESKETIPVALKEPTKEINQPRFFSVADLKAQLKQKEELKLVLQDEFFKVAGQIQLLLEQINALEKK